MKDESRAAYPAPSIRYDSADKVPQRQADSRLARTDIQELAERYRIPLYEDPGVVDALARLDASAVIPHELYGVVADVLGFIYRLDENPATNPAPK